MYPMFTCDEEALRRHDSTFNGVGDTKDVNPEVLHSVLNFIEVNWEDCSSVEVNEDLKESLTVDTAIGGGCEVPETMKRLLQLKQIGDRIREQCKMITDLSYNMEDTKSGEVILSHLCDLYSYFYSNCQDHRGIVSVHKDHLKFKKLTGKRRNKGFFRRCHIIPFFPSRNRKPKTSRFGNRTEYSGTTSDEILTTTSEDWPAITTSDEVASQSSAVPMDETDTDLEMELKDISPFVSLEAYKGQDDRKSQEHGTPGLLPRSD